jgi:sugar transferase (PEP-CTERM/EpsH1 system associated)
VDILFLTYRFPYPLDRGDRLTVFHLLRAMSARHRVTLLTFEDGHEPPGGHERLAAFCYRIETVRLSRARSWAQAWLGLASSWPSQVAYFASGRMARQVRETLDGGAYDAVFVHTNRMARYLLGARHRAQVLWLGDSLGLVLGRSLAFAPWWKRPGIAWERHRMDRWEARISRDFRETWALSPADRADLERIGCERVVLVTHGVDERLFELEHMPAPEPRLVFLGNLSVPHNVDAAVFAAREVFPRVRAIHPDARLCLAGAEPAPAVRRLADLDGVEVPGWIDDLRPVWAQAHALLAPLRFSTGIQNKVLEAMAAGVPVVTTGTVARALGARDREHVLVAEDAAALAAAVVETLADAPAARARASRAREHVRAHFSWETAVRRLERVAADAATAPPVPAAAAARA